MKGSMNWALKLLPSIIQSMTVLDGLGTGRLGFSAQEANLDYLAAVLNFSELRDSLLAKVSSSVISNKEITSFILLNQVLQHL